MCLNGASWLHQQILQTNPDARLQVYAVWMPMLPTDSREEWDDHLLNDPRVTHLWDQERVAGRWFADHGFGEMPIQWDAYLLFGADADWPEPDEAPSELVGWGRPIIGRTDELTKQLEPLLESGDEAANAGDR